MLGTGCYRRRGTGPVILTVALNATVNVSYEAEEISWGAPNQISRMTSRAGGGSLAVARVLAGLGEDVLVAGFAGGGGGRPDRDRPGPRGRDHGLHQDQPRITTGRRGADEAREESTRLSEPAPFITTEELGRFAGEFRKLVPGHGRRGAERRAPGRPAAGHLRVAGQLRRGGVSAGHHPRRRPGPVAQPGPPPRPGAARVHGRGSRRGAVRGAGRPGDPGFEGGGHAVRCGTPRRGGEPADP